MSAPTPQSNDFLEKFDQSLERLSQLNEMINERNVNTARFSSFISGKLQSITQKISEITAQVDAMKKELESLKTQVTENGTNIGNKDQQIAELTSRISALEAEKEDSRRRVDQIMQQAQAEKLALENEVQKLRGDVATRENELETKKLEVTSLQAQIQALQDDMAKSGDRLKEDYVKQMQEMEARNRAIIDQMTADHQALATSLKQREDELTALKTQMAEADALAKQELQKIQEQLIRTTSVLTKLTNENQALKQQNERLIQKIISATDAIYKATQNLDDIQYKQQRIKDFNQSKDIIDQIERSLENISRAIAGQAPRTTGGRRLRTRRNRTRKIRRMRKQRGGFEYSTTNKRKAISSTFSFTKKRQNARGKQRSSTSSHRSRSSSRPRSSQKNSKK